MNSPNRATWRGYFAISLFWMAVLAGALLFTRQPAATPIEIIPPPTLSATATAEPPPTAAATNTPRPLRVDVVGAVREPGVHTLPPGSIVDDAIRSAGGPSADADLEQVNKAVELQDGAQVYVPRRNQAVERPLLVVPSAMLEAIPTAGKRNAADVLAGSAAGELIDINRATLSELDTLPGVGPKTAQLIVEGRPYGTVDDLLRVKGIGPATLAKIKPLVTTK